MNLYIDEIVNLDLKGLARSSVTDSTNESKRNISNTSILNLKVTPELKTSNKGLLKNIKQKDMLHLPCSLESLVEDEEDYDKLMSNQQEILKLENGKLKQSLQEKDTEIAILKESHSVTKTELEDDIVVKTSMISRISKEQEAIKAHLELAKEEIEQLKIKMNDSAIKLKKANDETSTMKKRLATKVKEALIQKERFDAIEKQYNDKSREVDTMIKKKESDDKAYQENMTGMKGKLNYLTQKFTEYLTQNTSLQSELQEKTTAVKKIDTAFKDHIKKADDQKQKLDLRICELEQQIKTSSSACQTVEKETETDTPYSLDMTRRQMEEQLVDMKNQNQNLKDTFCDFQKEAERLQKELLGKNNELFKMKDSHAQDMKDIQSERKRSNMMTLKNDGIAKTLIESLHGEIDSLRREKEALESALEVARAEIENINVKNSDLTTKASEYQLEFKYLSECLNESLWRSNGSNDSVIIFGHERNEELPDLENQEAERNLRTCDISPKDPRKSLKIVQEYVGKLETLEQRTKNLDEEIEMMNQKIETLRKKNMDEDQASTEMKGILDVYKKLIENKQLEIENLKKRVKGKTGLLSANMRLLSKLEALFTQKLNELSEVSQTQDQLVIENKKLHSTIRDQEKEIKRLRELHCKQCENEPTDKKDELLE